LFRRRAADVGGVASAQDRRQNEPGQFDFYVLSLSWSPSFARRRVSAARRRNSSAALALIPSLCMGVAAIRKGFPEFCSAAGAAARP